jgi:hypothetical protein
MKTAPVLCPQERREREETVGRWRVRLISYRLGEEFFCTADNVDPGANLARVRGAQRDEVEAQALAQARQRLERTREIAG